MPRKILLHRLTSFRQCTCCFHVFQNKEKWIVYFCLVFFLLFVKEICVPLNSINSLFCLPYISTLYSFLILSMTVSFSAIRSNIYFNLLLKSWECLFCCNATIKHEKELANSSHNLLFTDGNMSWQYPCAPKEKI